MILIISVLIIVYVFVIDTKEQQEKLLERQFRVVKKWAREVILNIQYSLYNYITNYIKYIYIF